METKENEKAMRLQVMLQEAIKPINEKLEKLEQEMETIRKGQEELNKKFENK